MEIEVSKEMAATPARVASIMFDPRRDSDWMGAMQLVEVPHRDWLAAGTRIRRDGNLMGRKFNSTARIEEHVPDRLLRYSFVDGPISGEVSYRIEPSETGSLVTIHDRSQYSFTVMSWMVRKTLTDDLDRLARLVEGPESREDELEPASELDAWGSEPD